MVGISYDVKVSGFMPDCGAGTALQAESLQEEALIAAIDEQLQTGSPDRQIAYGILKELECKNVLAAKDLLEE